MPLDAAPRSANGLLSSLSLADFELLRPYLHPVEMIHKTLLVGADAQIEQAYFPHGGVISLVVPLVGGEMIEVAMVGRDSVFGAGAAIDGRTSMVDAIVQVPGEASAIDIAHLRTAAQQSASMRERFVRHQEFILAQAQQAAACNAAHTVNARLARWLLRVRDLTGSDRMGLTQEFLAQMMGVQRTSVSGIASVLQNAGVIRYVRGNIEISDLKGLEAMACECHATLQARGRILLRTI
jgi:CRP-like cAMP-binding protein